MSYYNTERKKHRERIGNLWTIDINGKPVAHVDNPYITTMCRIFRKYKNEFRESIKIIQEFREYVASSYGAIIGTPRYLFRKDPKDPTKVLVYGGFPYFNVSDPAYPWKLTSTFCNDFYKKICTDTNNPASNAWLPVRRAKKSMWKTTKVSITKLGSILGINGSEAICNEFGAFLKLMYSPPEFKLAEKPEDFVEMYSTGPHSCMSPRSSNAGAWNTWMIEEINHVPASFYAYCPNTKGAYLVDSESNNVIARTVLMRKSVNSPWKYTRIYSGNRAITNLFISKLQSLGMSETNIASCEPEKWEEFDIPLFTCGMHKFKYFPLPFIDYCSYPIWAKTDEKAGVVTVSFTKKHSHYESFSASSTQGFARIITKVACCVCGNREDSTHYLVDKDDPTKWYCGVECVKKANKVMIYDSNRNRVIGNREGVYISPADPATAYTNLQAAIYLGYFFVSGLPFFRPESPHVFPPNWKNYAVYVSTTYKHKYVPTNDKEFLTTGQIWTLLQKTKNSNLFNRICQHSINVPLKKDRVNIVTECKKMRNVTYRGMVTTLSNSGHIEAIIVQKQKDREELMSRLTANSTIGFGNSNLLSGFTGATPFNVTLNTDTTSHGVRAA